MARKTNDEAVFCLFVLFLTLKWCIGFREVRAQKMTPSAGAGGKWTWGGTTFMKAQRL